MVLKVGMKTWSGNGAQRINSLAEIGDFTEVMIEPNKDYKYLKDISTKWVIHCPHMHFGFNPSNEKRWQDCKKMLDNTQNAADFLGADKIIVHFGYASENNDGVIENALENSIEFFRNNKDKRILLENESRVAFDKGKYVKMTASAEDVKKVLEKTGCGFCLDLGHAWISASLISIDPKKSIENFMKLNPKHFHMLDSTSLNEDTHSNLGNGVLDVAFMRDTIKKHNQDAMVTLETPYNLLKNKEEIAFMKS